MSRKQDSSHPHADEFMQGVSLVEFADWLIRNGNGFCENIGIHKPDKKMLYEWIQMFLEWSEYEDFIESDPTYLGSKK